MARQDIVDLEEVVRRDAETLDQRPLDRLRYFGETDLVILAFQRVDLCERHVGLPLKCRARSGRGGYLQRSRGNFDFFFLPQSISPALKFGATGCVAAVSSFYEARRIRAGPRVISHDTC